MTGNPITIDVLETLDTIDRRGSFAKAAEELNKATSAISYAVQKLEEQLDIALLQRLGRRSVLTPAGQLILAEGREILQTTTRLANKAKEVATSIGFPILIKASAGGGGKGMRVVEKEADFESQMDRAISEAIAAFGDGSVFIEKYVSSPRHIEIQVLADNHGNAIHLFERECSV